MSKILLAIGLVAVSCVLPWVLGPSRTVLAGTAAVAPESEAGGLLEEPEELVGFAAADFAVGRLVISPTAVTAGRRAAISLRVQTRMAGVATVEVAIRDAQDNTVWQMSRTDQSFRRRQARNYTATWTPPAAQAAGSYTLTARVLNGAGDEVARPRVTRFRVIAAAGGAAPAAPLPTTLPTPASTGQYPFAITGSATFVGNIKAGLELMRAQAPADYATIATHVTEIKEGPQNYAWGGSRSIQISASSAGHSRTYAGSIVLHEAVHVKNWFGNDFPVFGCDGEAKSLRAQADFLYKVGDGDMARWVEGQIGTWC